MPASGPAKHNRPYAAGQYDVVTLPNGVSPVGQLRDPDDEYSFVDASHYPVKSYTFEITEEAARRARQAAVDYSKAHPNYNAASLAVCTDYALSILHAALSETNLGQLSRVPSILQKQLKEAAENGSVVSFPVGDGIPDYKYRTDLPPFAPDPEAPKFSAPPKTPATTSDPYLVYPPFGEFNSLFPLGLNPAKRSSLTLPPDAAGPEQQTAASTISQQEAFHPKSPLLRELVKRKSADAGAPAPTSHWADAALQNATAAVLGNDVVTQGQPSPSARSDIRILRPRPADAPVLFGLQVSPADTTVPNELSPADRASSFADRFGSWGSSANAIVPPSTYQQFSLSPLAVDPIGFVSGELVPDYPFPPPIFGGPTPGLEADQRDTNSAGDEQAARSNQQWLARSGIYGGGLSMDRDAVCSRRARLLCRSSGADLWRRRHLIQASRRRHHPMPI
jgi:hypothetical protein